MRRGALAIACGIIALVALARPTHARSLNAEEAALLKLVDGQHFIKARERAFALLQRDPDSLVGNWSLALVFEESEANYARALFYLRKAEKRAALDRDWFNKVLTEEGDVLALMGRDAEALAAIDRHDALFPPVRQGRRIWSLFKLGRIDEARRLGRALLDDADPDTRAQAYNGLLSLEFEQHDRDATYRWAAEAVRVAPDDCVILRNAAGAAFMRFRYAQAEEWGLLAIHSKDAYPGNGYDQLAGLYLVEGQFQKALAAVKRIERQRIERVLWPQYAMLARSILQNILYALGKVPEAQQVAAEVYALPQRVGMVSGREQHEQIIRTANYWTALGARLVYERERRSYRRLWQRRFGEGLRAAWTHWEVGRALFRLLARNDTLVTMMRPNLGEIYEWPAWQVASLAPLIGNGVAQSTLARARALDARYPEAAAYYDAVTGELAYRRGDLAEADRLATRALGKLVKEESLLRWRTLAWQADARVRLGHLAAAAPLFAEVLDKLPSVLRLLDLRLPVQLGDDGSALARQAAARLAGSSRFWPREAAPFKLQAATRDGRVEICLRDGRGTQIDCATGDRGERAVLSALDAFHAACFSPKVSMQQLDLNSLDGSTTRASADEALSGLLKP